MKDNTGLSIGFIYGIFEGPLLSRGFRRTLMARGFTITSDIGDADIIIAHSGGCYLIPPNSRPKVVVYIGYTYWPGRRLLDSAQGMLAYDLRNYRLLYLLKRLSLNILYFFRITHTVHLVRQWPTRGKFLQTPLAPQQIFIRNHHDSFCEPTALVNQAELSATYLSLPGGHNDIWKNPTTYVNLLQSVL